MLRTESAGPLPNIDRVARQALKGSSFELWLEQIGHRPQRERLHSHVARARRRRWRSSAMTLVGKALGGGHRLRSRALHPSGRPSPQASARTLQVRGNLSRSARPALAQHPRRPRLQRRHEDGGRRARASPSGRSSGRRSTSRTSVCRSKESLEQPVRPHSAARRALLLDRRAHSARDGRQPLGNPRQPGGRRSRALQDPPPGARAHRARTVHRLRPDGAAGVSRTGALVHQPAST